MITLVLAEPVITSAYAACICLEEKVAWWRFNAKIRDFTVSMHSSTDESETEVTVSAVMEFECDDFQAAFTQFWLEN